MYKRVSRRIERLQQEEALGLTEEVLGLNDTDSDESGSASSSSSSADEGSGDQDEAVDLADEPGSDADSTSSPSPIPRIPIPTALTTPLYPLAVGTHAHPLQACIICPGKQLMHESDAKVHLGSKAHTRRLRRFQSYVSSHPAPSLDSDAASLVHLMDAALPQPPSGRTGTGPRTPPSERPRAPNRKARRAAMRGKGLEGSAGGDEGVVVVEARPAPVRPKKKQREQKKTTTDTDDDAPPRPASPSADEPTRKKRERALTHIPQQPVEPSRVIPGVQQEDEPNPGKRKLPKKPADTPAVGAEQEQEGRGKKRRTPKAANTEDGAGEQEARAKKRKTATTG